MRVILLTAVLFAASTCGSLNAQPSAPTLDGSMIFDVRNGDQTGKLMLKDTELAFESLTDAKHSRNWKYAEIRAIEKPKSELRVKPFKGSRYDFQFKDKKMRDRIYDLITQRVLTARQGRK